MIILNNMYTGRYISSWGNLGHEAINLIKADDGKFYIWLNSMGVFPKYKANEANGCAVIMVRSINSHLYKVLAYAKNCSLCPGADIPRKKNNSGVTDKTERYAKQKALSVTYNGKCPMDEIYREQDMFATFCTDEVYEAIGDVYLTNEESRADDDKNIFYADFTISEAMRAYIEEQHPAKTDLESFISKPIWNKIESNNISCASCSEFNFFKLIRKERDELSISNALAYFIENTGKTSFLKNCLELSQSFLHDNYELLREKNNIDISFFGEQNVVIIENKIDAGITYNGRITLESQINRAVELYYDDSLGDKAAYKSCIEQVISNYQGDTSQLSKYYIYALAYLLTKGVDVEDVENHIKCFLLIPRYSINNFPTVENGCYDSTFCVSNKYKIITYKEILEYFDAQNIINPYFSDFKSALKPLASEFDNELEQEMKLRFLKEIGMIQA